MTISELGALGELVGGIAIIISLIYVGIQIRQGASASRAATTQAFSQQYSDLNQMLVRSDVRDVFARGLIGLDQLRPDEVVGFISVLSAISRTLESFYFQTLNGGLEKKLFEGWFTQYLDLFANKGAGEFWESRRHQYTKEFVDYVDQKIKLHVARPLYGRTGAEHES